MQPRAFAWIVASGLLTASSASSAQSQSAPTALEDLIPDSAVENPEAWANEDGPNSVEVEPDVVPADPPFADDALDLPEPDIDQSALEPRLTAEPQPFAEVAELPLPTAPELQTVQIDDGLELAYPSDPIEFPDGTDFISRFKALRDAREIGDEGENIALRAAFIRADRELLTELLRAFGYYDARVWRQFEDVEETAEADDETPRVSLAIFPGARYKFGAIDLGDLGSAPDYQSLRSTFAIETGDDISADRIVDQRDELGIELGETGYPFAVLDEPSLLIDHDRGEGDLTLPVEPGGKFVFGEITSNLPEFLSAKHISRIARFEQGDVYKRSLEQDLRTALLATGIVSSVTITPRPVDDPQGETPGEVAMDVAIQKGRLRTIAGAIGYGTEDGAKIEASWEHRNLFPPEGALLLRGVLGTRELLASVGLRRNNFRGRDQLLSFDAYGSDIETEAVEARTVGLRAAFERDSNLIFQKEWAWQVGAEVLWTDERNRIVGGIARPRQEYLIGGLFGRVTYDQSNNFLDPTDGYRASLFVAPEVSRAFDDETFYVRSQVDGSFYQRVGGSVTAAARVRAATIQGAQTFEIAPSRRLYAGGGSSVRGYGFQAVGPRNDFGEPTGGLSLVELSAEARIDTGFFDGALQIVPFFDLGTVSIDNTPDFRFVKYGAGVGVRYKTGFGPIRVDVGVPLNRNSMFDSPVAVYVSLGQAF
ncbi:hypothetical protein BPTFM16_01543 [Altererythrobacter insulae]|nr:hypothetical protein BPTFM16_01543 [Altererythrobacter insulae]